MVGLHTLGLAMAIRNQVKLEVDALDHMDTPLEHSNRLMRITGLLQSFPCVAKDEQDQREAERVQRLNLDKAYLAGVSQEAAKRAVVAERVASPAKPPSKSAIRKVVEKNRKARDKYKRDKKVGKIKEKYEKQVAATKAEGKTVRGGPRRNSVRGKPLSEHSLLPHVRGPQGELEIS